MSPGENFLQCAEPNLAFSKRGKRRSIPLGMMNMVHKS